MLSRQELTEAFHSLNSINEAKERVKSVINNVLFEATQAPVAMLEEDKKESKILFNIAKKFCDWINVKGNSEDHYPNAAIFRNEWHGKDTEGSINLTDEEYAILDKYNIDASDAFRVICDIYLDNKYDSNQIINICHVLQNSLKDSGYVNYADRLRKRKQRYDLKHNINSEEDIIGRYKTAKKDINKRNYLSDIANKYDPEADNAFSAREFNNTLKSEIATKNKAINQFKKKAVDISNRNKNRLG